MVAGQALHDSARQVLVEVIGVAPTLPADCILAGQLDGRVAQLGALLAANGHGYPATPSLITPSQTPHPATSGITQPPNEVN